MINSKKPDQKKNKKTKGKESLTQLKRRLVENYFSSPTNDLEQAYIDAGGKSKTPKVSASQLFDTQACKDYYQSLLEDQKKRTGMDADAVLDMWARIATCDVNEIVQHRLEACRYCYGKDHHYHWVDHNEYDKACQKAEKLAEMKGEEVALPSDAGGFGFDPNDSPHAKCPECHGNGVARVHINDTRRLSGAAALLYDGVEITKNGLKIKTLNRDAAIVNLGRHFGLLNDKLMLDVPKDSPLSELIKQVSGNTLKPPSANKNKQNKDAKS